MKIVLEDSKDFKFLSDDSREVSKDCAFFVTQSSKKYLKEAQEKGCKFFVTPKELSSYLKLNLQCIGITGTNGKTTTAAMIYSILLDMGYKVGLLGTRGFFINGIQKRPKGLTTPSTLEIYTAINEAKQEGCEFFVMEVSSHAITQNRIEGLEFALKILTNITSDHLDYHKTLENYIATKNSFFSNPNDKKLINKDEKNAQYPLQNTLTYGIESTSTFSIKAYSLKGGITAQITYGSQVATLDSPLLGKHNLYNALAAIGAVQMLTQKPLQEIANQLENFGGVMGRMQIINQKPLIVVDFAHTEDGMEQIFQSFLHQKIAVLFGAGGDRDKTKRPKMGFCASKYAQKIYITSDNPRNEDPKTIMQEILSGIPQSKRSRVILEENRALAIQKAIAELKEDEVLLVLGKGDETYQIIGDRTLHFDDSEEIKKALKAK
ncbi:UDP-N-acetylmuramoyl-L-alanyl-D-glutamate--2,6-diaminopimelate ligase [Helicobacter canadensis]|uniref:UDP-N-acetylmuramoyl-L-alanyl-D-glutamate--2,6-diaminopimelate ligase n=1 Tax=Helicobacter canadensis MIT 98-5491 TaxID=537970 RepID=C5ZYI0_9HELI|nr:UDP-N-acetylmuramoyl-L-alanyl-D-glutamate--2,6-diaminopimelate ligase [Helicobacter canadensis]EES90198.1 UDP-N-acetylmuramoylalanyl-D-glutamate--2,6- diaminopimelate ligase [Helicobacter canadensis MIT 98-5491]EFR49356.1 putative UDP-N-acetylmuramoyl-L-alanyl-D-glutamate--2,6-diaminopimelate ligase [Helicobacter canadensis MIT 98-5491]STP02296.1 UDP-N-acetylmuramoylalanyl-D-glutamate-2, 6-diaminopimelate ligase [Helicobacter canadensis]